jgi:hypothetical protein
MKCAIFIRTYHKDEERLWYCLRSIEKFCRGFSETVVVCPPSSQRAIKRVTEGFSFVTLLNCREYDIDSLGQQLTKMQAHKFVDSEYVFHLDSDCIFNQHFTPGFYFKDGLPILYNCRYEELKSRGIPVPWQEPTSKILGRPVEREFMALFPLVYPKALYSETEQWLNQNYKGGHEYLIARLDGITDFSEFNFLGAFSFYCRAGLQPMHRHIDWTTIHPTHYVTQLCQEGRQFGRLIRPHDRELLNSILGD